MRKSKFHKKIDGLLDKIDAIKNVNVKTEYQNILSSPRNYFQKYIIKMDGWALILAKMEIYFKLRELDHHGMNHSEEAKIMISRLSVSGYIDLLKVFYRYALETVNFLLDDSANVMLDLYNDKKIDGVLLGKIMGCIDSGRDMMLRDKQDISNAIQSAEEEQKRVDDLTSGSQSGFMDVEF